MVFKILEAVHNNLTFRIEEDNPEVGVYLYIIENDNCIRDYLQNDIETCKKIAFEEHGVSFNSWKMR